ncbi:store-operated calcium entry regulator STIMATE-like [Neocloeon triangulifer]|uniref:store-operated calcium entry regulator STIMATE-like n=1 Tax=Neocloeon triangulifer TaxID=2078957 RepID=UPI00286F27CC|nr:store-operated calcium entry regulator STIMATE-like [Neocloeon triangulifer]XP_059480286.1 store-operated calcium entry regulator STIMATE-like [Neocloeon triangulifer]
MDKTADLVAPWRRQDAVQEHEGLSCGKDDLTNIFGWTVQALLAALAFTCLILKRFCEPSQTRRPWLIWFYDTSKQGAGALVVHMANVYLASRFIGDACTWYIISFLLDSSLGLCLIYVGIKLSQFLARFKQWELINFGEYGKPPSSKAWLAQCGVYILLMIVEKVFITLLVQFEFWEGVSHLILAPVGNPKVEVTLVMLIIPFFVNILMFWVTDNFLMHHSASSDAPKQRASDPRRPFHRARFRVQNANLTTRLSEESESEILLSGDDDVISPSDAVTSGAVVV